MSDPGPADDPVVEAALVRPFLNRLQPWVSTVEPPAGQQPAAEIGAAADVRAYAITGGRSDVAVPLEFESMLQTTRVGTSALGTLSFERASIARRCAAEILSVAELSALLRIPIGVVRVVAADLVSEGILDAFLSELSVADDVSLITRLIEGVRAL